MLEVASNGHPREMTVSTEPGLFDQPRILYCRMGSLFHFRRSIIFLLIFSIRLKGLLLLYIHLYCSFLYYDQDGVEIKVD